MRCSLTPSAPPQSASGLANASLSRDFRRRSALYRDVLGVELPWLQNVDRVQRPAKLPVVFTREEAQQIIACTRGTARLMLQLMYGCGLRVLEVCRLRVKDVDFGYLQITVRDGKGGKDRITMLPVSLVEDLRRQIEDVQLQHREDLAAGLGEAWLPHALGVKKPGAARKLAWQYVFPAARLSRDPRDPSAKPRRHHVDESLPQRAVKTALKLAHVRKAGTCHSFRHSFATHLLEAGYDICRSPAGSRPAGSLRLAVSRRLRRSAEQCRSYSDIRTFPPPKFIRTS